MIPVRFGSKRVKNKNLRLIDGKPLISYTIEASLQSNVDETWVSTDSSEIASVSSTYGASVIDRPNEISTDTSQSEEALLHFTDNHDFDIMVFIQPTSPLLKSIDINKGLELMSRYDSILSVTREHWIPKWSMDMNPIDWEIDNRPMRQDKEETFLENGAFYITKRKNLLIKTDKPNCFI